MAALVFLFINIATRAMTFLNIGISVLAVKSNVQAGSAFLMYEVIINVSSMKSLRAAVQEYDTDLPLYIAILGRRLGRNLDVSASTSTDEPAVITEDGNEKEEIQESSYSVEIQ